MENNENLKVKMQHLMEIFEPNKEKAYSLMQHHQEMFFSKPTRGKIIESFDM